MISESLYNSLSIEAQSEVVLFLLPDHFDISGKWGISHITNHAVFSAITMYENHEAEQLKNEFGDVFVRYKGEGRLDFFAEKIFTRLAGSRQDNGYYSIAVEADGDIREITQDAIPIMWAKIFQPIFIDGIAEMAVAI